MTTKAEKRKRQKEALRSAIGAADAASAPVQNNDVGFGPELVSTDKDGTPLVNAYTTKSKEDFEPLFTPADGTPEPEAEAASEPEPTPPPRTTKPKSAFTKHLQSLIIERMTDAISVFAGQRPGSSTLHTLKPASSKDKFGVGPYVSDLLPGGKVSEFLHATPAQLGSLVPLLRFYMVDNKGNENEIYFADYVSTSNIEMLATQRMAGSIRRSLPARNKRGSNVGIKSFDWNYNNKHEGDKIIEAELELYFGDMTELMNGNYLQFIFTTGLSAPSAADIGKPNADGSRQVVKTDVEVQIGLENSISTRKASLKKGNPDSQAKRYFQDKKEDAAAAKRDFRQLKVVCGWSIPKGVDVSVFGGKKKFENFKEGLRRTQRAIILNLIDYNVEFQQEGTATMSMRYVGSTDNYLATNSSDIFGSADPAQIATFFTPIEVAASEAGTGNKKGATTPDVNKVVASDPYLSRVGALTSNTGDTILQVTMGGLQFASQIANDERRLLEITQGDLDKEKGTKTSDLEAVEDRMELIILLYNKALDLQRKELYNNFLRRVITSQNLKVGRVTIVNGDDPDQTKHKVDLAFGTAQVEDQQIRELLQKQTKAYNAGVAALSEEERQAIEAGRSGGPGGASFDPTLIDPLAGDTKSVTFYYMRLGDIIKAAMEQCSFRSDISFVLGNFEDAQGSAKSIYDIPITLGSFGQFFFNTVASRQLSTMPFDQFFRSLMKTVSNMLAYAYKGTQRITFDFTSFNSTQTPPSGPLTKNVLKSIGSKAENPLVITTNANETPVQAHTYYTVFSRKVDHKNRRGDRRADESQGIYHYVLGADRGLAKTFNFSRQDTKYFQEMLIEASNMEDNIRALFLPQNVSIEMYGNGIHRNGDLIFVDSRAALGNWAGTKLGIGGYYRVVRSSHSISNRGYTTNLECVFELRAPSGAVPGIGLEEIAPDDLIGMLDEVD